MRAPATLFSAALIFAAAVTHSGIAHADECHLTPKDVVTRFMTKFYLEKQVREAFETWVEPGYIQHNPLAKTGRDAAIAFLEPFFKSHPDASYSIKRIVADGNLVAVHSHAKFTADDRGLAVVDILRVDHCKVAEHWDVVQPVPEKSANTNGMF
ncbi:MAG TPA: nuclear transport factor 2 family protein [Steroidobacteraceae bacterium]